MKDIRVILEEVKNGTMDISEASLLLKKAPFADIGDAKIDTHRKLRRGVGEVIYGAGKSAPQICDILKSMRREDEDSPILITRVDPPKAIEISKMFPIYYHEKAESVVLGDIPEPDGLGTILIATGGTSDIPVAEEAYITARVFGNKVNRQYDVGVAGIHRLFAHIDDIMEASVIIAIAGMEGALASVIAGLSSAPVIAVPTSVGYGASFGGISALLGMLNSCSGGVSVVNIDNGFGAAYQASLINHLA